MNPDRLIPERALFAQGIRGVAGVDEAGCGPLAGPVVAAAVVLPEEWILNGLPGTLVQLNDSKQLSESARDEFFTILLGDALVLKGIASIDPKTIDAINILRATHRGMNFALKSIQPLPTHALVDGLRVPSLILPQTPLVKGDSRSYSIAAASVLAKVTRDRMMLDADRRWPQYGFARHKGYPTPEHLEALRLHGPCEIHRKSFAPLRTPDPELFSSL